MKTRVRANPERDARTRKAWYYANPEKVKEMKWARQGINVTMAEYNQMYDDQLGCCKICGKHRSEQRNALALDHSHETGEIRGLLCHNCNVGLGQFQDDPELLTEAALYLRQ